MTAMPLIEYRAARAWHLNVLQELRKSRRKDGSYPDAIGLRVSKVQQYLVAIRMNLAGKVQWPDGSWH